MKQRRLKCLFFSAAVILLCNVPIMTAASGLDDEIKYLNMFYAPQELVVTSTRYPKPVSEVPDNIEFVTAEDIQKMNAHTVAEVLDRVTGVFLNTYSRDFGSASFISIQGSESRHVRVLVDGVTWNMANSGSAETHSIPVGMIDRIEIIKGPASAVWGSSLGGVVHIITKSAGNTESPVFFASGSCGERDTLDYRARISGRIDRTRYLLSAGYQDSDGLRDSRAFDNPSLFSKLEHYFSDHVSAMVSMGISRPDIRFFDDPSNNLSYNGETETFFAEGTLDAELTSCLKMSLACHQFKQGVDFVMDTLDSGECYSDRVYDETIRGASGRLVWEKVHHTTVLGIDMERGEIDQTACYKNIVISRTDSNASYWSVYANENFRFGPYAVTFGILYDEDSVAGSFISPSAGGTWQLNDDTVLRASVSRGFSRPPLSWTSGVTLFDNYTPNPELKPEKIRSYQAGFETRKIPWLCIKNTLYYHYVYDGIQFSQSGNKFIPVNEDIVRRRGIELDVKTAPLRHLSFGAGGAYERVRASEASDTDKTYTFHLAARYEDSDGLYAELYGKYAHLDWDVGESRRDVIWDLNMNFDLSVRKPVKANVFCTLHNVFNGAQYVFEQYQNPDRWVEAGIRVEF